MAKIASLVVAVVLAVAIQGAPSSFDDIVEAAKSGNWEIFQSLLNANLASNPEWKPVDFHSIKELKPPQGGQVYGEAEYTFQSSSDFDGQKTEERGGHKIINNNGKVKEFDFQP
ncbi:unnamed protein product [Arctia plantaginis]|uniref:Uncharacterized protein n=1 Tax=Arctia plantaginis TaxID=874455 RepID=A0A8S1A1M1_ARCPL|nr:unnamed protein product [Arctia plantaginis]CAB3240287.1 unnamed protein product [Arctia plantaginis]